MAGQPTFEELFPEESRGSSPPIEMDAVEKIPTGEPPASFNELFPEAGLAPTSADSVKVNEEYWDAGYYSDKAKFGMAALLSLPGLGLDFIHDMQYAALDMFNDIDQGINDAFNMERTIRGEKVPPEAFKAIKPTLPYGMERQMEAYETILFSDFAFEEREKDISFGKKTLGTIFEFAGASAFPAAGIVSKVQGTVPKLITAGTEVASVIAGGIGTETGVILGKEIHPSLEQAGRLTGTIFGSIAPYTFPSILRPAITKLRGYFDKEFQESIKRGEKDIEEGKVTVCKTEKELDDFFVLI